jgi:hypothetical protein
MRRTTVLFGGHFLAVHDRTRACESPQTYIRDKGRTRSGLTAAAARWCSRHRESWATLSSVTPPTRATS